MKASFYVDFTNTEVKISKREFESYCSDCVKNGVDLNDGAYCRVYTEFDDEGELEVESHLHVDAIREVLKRTSVVKDWMK